MSSGASSKMAGIACSPCCVNDAAWRDLEPAIAALPTRTCRFSSARREALADIAGYDVHRGCLALVHRPPDDVGRRAARAGARLLVVLEGVSNADNVGGVFRNAAAFGADGVLLSPTCCDPLYRKAIRTSMGATLRVPFARAGADDWPGVLARVRGRRLHDRRADTARAVGDAAGVRRAAARRRASRWSSAPKAPA